MLREHVAPGGVAELLGSFEGGLDRLPDSRRLERHDEAAAGCLDSRQLGLLGEHDGGARRGGLE